MKALVLAAALAALSSTALAGAARDTHALSGVDAATTVVLADAGRIGSASLTALHGSRWSPAEQQVQPQGPAENLALDIDTGSLLIGIGVLAFILSRPIARVLRRQEQQRRATALASTLGHTPRG